MLYSLIAAIIAVIAGKMKTMETKNVASLSAILGAVFTLLSFLFISGGQIGALIQFMGAGVFFVSIVINAIVAAVLAFGIYLIVKKVTGAN